MKNYLVVGANGIIGFALYHHLKSSHFNVWGTTHKQSLVDDHIFYLDLLNPCSSKFPDIHFDVAFLFAGVCRMNLCEENPEYTQKINIEGTRALVERLEDSGTFVIFPSTNQVFSGTVPKVDAYANYDPQNEYGRQKVKMEEWLRASSRSAIVRFTKVINPGLALLSAWINNLQSSQSVEAFTDMNLAPIALKDALDILLAIGHQELVGIYQASGLEDMSYYDLAIYLSKLLQSSSSLVHPISAFDKGIPKNFLPRFTTLDSESSFALCNRLPPRFAEVLVGFITDTKKLDGRS